MAVRNKGFTLAEVLITLTIIGVIAALTIPNLMQGYKKHQVEVGVKEAYSILSNALTMAKAEYGSLSSIIEQSNSAETPKKYFSQNYVEPYMKIVKAIDPNQYAEKVFNDARLKRIDGSTVNDSTTNSYEWRQLQLQNGMFMGITRETVSGKPIYWFIFDINGGKRPNKIAHDIFYFSLENEEPHRIFAGRSGGQYSWGCNSLEQAINVYGGTECSAKIMYNGWKIPDDYPVKKW